MVSHSDVLGGFEGEGNLAVNPLLYGPGTPEAYRLRSGSPCIGAGLSVGLKNLFDLDGRPRVRGRVDLGAYESPFARGGLMLSVK